MTEDQICNIRDRIGYDAATGKLTWKKVQRHRIKVGEEAGGVGSNGYRRVKILGRFYLGHRIAWLLHHGEEPHGMLDHVNGDRTDNRICNLRLATPAENGRNRKRHSNNTTGYKGVSPLQSGKYQAEIRVNWQKKYLGSFPTAEEAHAAYVAASAKYFGEFGRAA